MEITEVRMAQVVLITWTRIVRAARRQGLLLLPALGILFIADCGNRTAPSVHENLKRDQALPLTFGGLLKDGPEAERVDGICEADYTRTLLNCDIYNGLPGWTITEVTLVVTWSPNQQDDLRYYQVPAIIKPRATEHVTVRLGLRLPTGWSWQNVGAKGYPTK